MRKHLRYRNKDWYDEFWNKNPAAFGNPSEEITQLVIKISEYLKQKSLKKPTLIDIAAGRGRYIPLFRSNKFSVLAMDISKNACDIMRCLFSEDSGVKVVQGNFLNKNYTHDLFDVVFSSGLLEELSKKSQITAIKRMQNMTSEGGFLLLKYCIEIENRGKQVEDNFIATQFDSKEWEIMFEKEESSLRNYSCGVEGENRIRTGLLCAQKK